MTNDEKYLKKRVGNRNPYGVPEGYFERLTPELMQRLPEYPERKLNIVEPKFGSKVRPIIMRMRPLLYTAASLLIATFCIAVYFDSKDADNTQQLSIQTETSDAYYDEVADYAMVDNYDIYACLTSDY